MKHIISLHFLLLIMLTSCHKAESNEKSMLIFGQFHGFCMGEKCIETFKVTDSELYEDTTDQYKGIDGFQFVSLSQNKHSEVKDLLVKIPTELWFEDDKRVFGCPDCYDQGGFLIQMEKNGMTKSWFFDKDIKSNPDYLQAFLNQVSDKILIINN